MVNKMWQTLIRFALLLVQPQLMQCVLFKKIQATTDFLDGITEFYFQSSLLHCASSCLVATSYDNCASFHYDPDTNQCLCGRRMNFEVTSNNSQLHLHSNILCNKPSPPGIVYHYTFSFL